MVPAIHFESQRRTPDVQLQRRLEQLLTGLLDAEELAIGCKGVRESLTAHGDGIVRAAEHSFPYGLVRRYRQLSPGQFQLVPRSDVPLLCPYFISFQTAGNHQTVFTTRLDGGAAEGHGDDLLAERFHVRTERTLLQTSAILVEFPFHIIIRGVQEMVSVPYLHRSVVGTQQAA